MHDWSTMAVVSMADRWEAPKSPAFSDPNTLEHGCSHLGLADLLQIEEILQEDMLQLGESLHFTASFSMLLRPDDIIIPWEHLLEATAPSDMESLQSRQVCVA